MHEKWCDAQDNERLGNFQVHVSLCALCKTFNIHTDRQKRKFPTHTNSIMQV